MGRIQIEGGLERDEVYNKHGEQIGVAVYDLGDAQVRADLITFKDDLKSLGERYEASRLELQKYIDAFDRKIEEEKSKLKNGDTLSDDVIDKIEKECSYWDNIKALSELDIKCIDEMIVETDKVFGDDFCVNAIGKSKNLSDLWEVIGAVVESYGIKAKDEINKFTNRAGRRAGAKASNK